MGASVAATLELMPPPATVEIVNCVPIASTEGVAERASWLSAVFCACRLTVRLRVLPPPADRTMSRPCCQASTLEPEATASASNVSRNFLEPGLLIFREPGAEGRSDLQIFVRLFMQSFLLRWMGALIGSPV
jgi:hypothetical protein